MQPRLALNSQQSSCLSWITGTSPHAQLGLLTKQASLASLLRSPPDFSASFQGIDEGPEGLKLISDIIREKMGIDVSVLMGANIASEVAAEKFCETTIGEAAEGPSSTGVSLYYLPPLLPLLGSYSLPCFGAGSSGPHIATHMLYL